MDLAADQLAAHLAELPNVEAVLARYRLRTARHAQQPTALGRALGRFVQLPCQLAPLRWAADYFHIADHSYAHLALLFPRERVGVFCHDIDAFRALLPGANVPYSRVLLSRVLLRGMQHAQVVFHTTQAVREEILLHGLVPASRLVQAPLGLADEYLQVRPGPAASDPYLLHVSSCIPRKNVDFLLRVFCEARTLDSALRLVQIGGQWTDAQQAYLDREGLGPYVEQKRGLPRRELAQIYARASAVMVPSLAEGFGLPVIEALACGAPVVASDIPVLREVGGDGVRFCSATDRAQWVQAIREVLCNRTRVEESTRSRILERYSWRAHAATIAEAYTARGGRGSEATATS